MKEPLFDKYLLIFNEFTMGTTCPIVIITSITIFTRQCKVVDSSEKRKIEYIWDAQKHENYFTTKIAA